MKNLEFDSSAFEDLAWWIKQDRKKALRIIKLLKEVQRTPFEGTGKPEALKHDLPVAGPDVSTKNTAWSTKSKKTRSEFWLVDITISLTFLISHYQTKNSS